MASHQLTPEMAEPISRAETVVFVDCSAVAEAGEVSCSLLRPRGRTMPA